MGNVWCFRWDEGLGGSSPAFKIDDLQFD